MIAFLRTWWRRCFPQSRRVVLEDKPALGERPPATHELNLATSEACVLKSGEHGRFVVLYGWTPKHWHWNEGDYLVLRTGPGRSTRYRIESITRPGDPSTMYFADCRFAPRGVD